MTAGPEPLFRQRAMERHASPEGLDTLLEITTVRAWTALAALGAVLGAALLWGVLGTLPQAVPGQGIMVREGGLYRVQATGGGRIDSIFVAPGSAVRRGDVIAILAQPQLRTSIQQLEQTLADLRANRATTGRLVEADRTLALESIRQQQRQADEAIVAADQRLAYLDERIANERRAVTAGLLTSDVLQSTVALRAETQLQKLSTAARKQELAANAVQLQVSANQNLFQLDQQILQARNQLEQLTGQSSAFTTVTSPYAGTVMERLADPGQTIGAGEALVTMEPDAVPLQVLMFIPLEGKRIRPGMRVEMVPGGVKPEDTGYFLGAVRSVSAAPLSGSALDRYLKNELLVEQFTREGGAYLVDVAVEADSTTVSGFRWTSRKGAPISFGSGTLLTGKIIVERTRPVQLVVPALRRWFGG